MQKNHDDSYLPKHVNSIGIIPILASGLVDAANPTALLCLVLCLFCLLSLGRSSLKVLIVGFSLISTVYICTFLSVLGAFDVYTVSIRVQTLLQGFYVFFSIVLILFGCINLYDWIRLRQGKGRGAMIVSWPNMFFQESRVEVVKDDGIRLFDFLALLLLGVSCGIGVSILESAWPPHYNLGSVIMDLAFPGRRLFAMLTIGLYTLMFVFPIIVITLVTSFVVMSDKFIEQVRRSISVVKVVIAGIFIGLGTALIYIFF